LPRLSGTDTPPAPAQQMPTATFAAPSASPPLRSSARYSDYVVGPELWLSVIIGLLLIGISRHFPVYIFDHLAGRPYHTGVIFTSDNSEVPYPQLEGFVMLSDAAIFAFGVALLSDAMLRLFCLTLGSMGRRSVMILALLLTLCATLLNAYACLKMLQADIMPIISGLAVAFGGYIAFEQIRTVKSLR
jgi:hypothetical protein